MCKWHFNKVAKRHSMKLGDHNLNSDIRYPVYPGGVMDARF